MNGPHAPFDALPVAAANRARHNVEERAKSTFGYTEPAIVNLFGFTAGSIRVGLNRDELYCIAVCWPRYYGREVYGMVTVNDPEERELIGSLFDRTGIALQRLAMVSFVEGEDRERLLSIVSEWLDQEHSEAICAVLYGAFFTRGATRYLPKLYDWHEASKSAAPDVVEALELAVVNDSESSQEIDETCRVFLRDLEHSRTTAFVYLLRMCVRRASVKRGLLTALAGGRLNVDVYESVKVRFPKLLARIEPFQTRLGANAASSVIKR